MSTSVDPTQPTQSADPTAFDPVTEIATALDTTANLDRLPTAHHVAAYERVHVALTDALSAIDEV
jgi:hypothetical protein